MPRHSREDALTEREFELLYQSISEMKSSKQLETARAYIGSSDTSAARELRFKYR